jgi:hypothetical protein
MRSTTYRTASTNPTNGVVSVTEKTVARAYTMFDANASLTKFSNRSGYTTNNSGTFGPGTYATGLTESSTSTNLADILGAVAAGVARGTAQGLK